MDGLIQKLRDAETGARSAKRTFGADLLHEAADEIVRLRAALQEIVDSDGRFDTMFDIAKSALAPEQKGDRDGPVVK